MGKTVILRPAVAESERKPRMQKTEESLGHAAMKHSPEDSVTDRNRPKSVSMAKAEPPAPELHDIWLDQTYHPEFLKKPVCPHIMVALEEIHLHSSVHQCSQGGEHTHISFRHDIPVLIPEIPYVTEQIHSLSILRKTLQEGDKTELTVGWITDFQAQMDV